MIIYPQLHMNIRAARPEEAAVLGAIACAAKASWGYTTGQLEAWRAELYPGAESIRARPTCVAEHEGQLAGFYQLDMASQPVELGHFWVHPRFMRRGVGRAMLAHAMQYLATRGLEPLHIDSDPHAEPFYAALGAVRIGALAAPIEGQPGRVRPQLRLWPGPTQRAVSPPTLRDRLAG